MPRSGWASLGLTAACVDKRGAFGGTCLNIGCIPSKALLHASERFHEAQSDFAKLGIKAKVELDLPAMMAQKDKVVGELTKGVEFLFRKNKVEGIVGEARITAPGKVEVKGKDGAAAQPVGQAHHHRHRLGCGAAARRHHRREADRLLHRRAGAEARCPRGCWWWAPA